MGKVQTAKVQTTEPPRARESPNWVTGLTQQVRGQELMRAERDERRSKPEAQKKRKEAEEKLKSRNQDERKNAAIVLRELRYADSYSVLLDALKKETEPEVKLRILEALKDIAFEHGSTPKLSRGTDEITKFIEKNFADIELVRAALPALRYSGNVIEVFKALDGLLAGQYPNKHPRADAEILSVKNEIELTIH